MDKSLSRRDFLKLGLASTALLSKPVWRIASEQPAPNILIILFDSWSACNLSLKGYPRETMPFLSELSKQAIVYHNHYSGGNYTTPGTASLLTGTPPQTHRAFSGNSRVINSLRDKNIFNSFQRAGYQTIAYTHNTYANTLLTQFSASISNFIPTKQLFLKEPSLLDRLLKEDLDTVLLSKDQVLLDTPASSLILSRVYTLLQAWRIDKLISDYSELFPAGLPSVGGTEFFTLEKGIDYIRDHSPEFRSPYLAYFHFLPPHGPYKTRGDFYKEFKRDGATFTQKPEHPLTEGYTREQMLQLRQEYDDFLLYVDSEFNRLFTHLKASGVLENTILVLTSDHGEMFERGIVRHGKATLHEPVIRIPLMLFMPGVEERVDIYDRTTAMDVLPTLGKLANMPVSETAEGIVIPPFGKPPAANRTFVIPHADRTKLNQPLTYGSYTIFKEDYKLNRYLGYPQIPEGAVIHEMYNIAEDPEELNDIVMDSPARAALLIEELTGIIERSNQPFLS